jgi:ABC transporter substrate binding protein
LALYRISIVNLPFPVKDVHGCGNYNIPFDSEKDFDFFLFVISVQARLLKVKDFALAQTAILCGYRLTAHYYLYDLFRACASFGSAFYGPDRTDMNRQIAAMIDKILKGTKPADLPVEQPTKFQLVINLKAAKQIGLTIPPNVLARANKVIR